MAGLVLHIRKATNASNNNPYAVVNFLNIQKSDLESTELQDNKIYSCTYDLSLIYPELKNENDFFDFEKAYSIFTKELFGIQKDVKCIDLPLTKVCKYNVLIKRSGGLKITSICRAYYTSEESVTEKAMTYVANQLNQKAWVALDEKFKIFIVDDKERYVKLANIKCIYNNTYKAEVAQGPYVLNALHNFQHGICYCHKDNYYEILIPFIYDSIDGCRMKSSSYDDFPWLYYFAKEKKEDNLYDIYSQYLDNSDLFDNTEHCSLPCLAHEANIVMINRRLQYILFHCHNKQGVIRNGKVFIKPQFSSINGHPFISEVEDYEEEYKIVFVVCYKHKKGLYFENIEVLPPVYDSICVEENTGICSLKKDNHYYLGGFKGENNNFSMREISEEEFYRMIEEEEKECKEDFEPGYEWTEEDTWDALTDGQFGPYPKNGVDWGLLDDFQGR